LKIKTLHKGGSVRIFFKKENFNNPRIKFYNKHFFTSDANDSRRFSPPLMPLIRPGMPILIFARFSKLNLKNKIPNYD
jgi:hypothetical protein